jgi:hypothetical protein
MPEYKVTLNIVTGKETTTVDIMRRIMRELANSDLNKHPAEVMTLSAEVVGFHGQTHKISTHLFSPPKEEMEKLEVIRVKPADTARSTNCFRRL